MKYFAITLLGAVGSHAFSTISVPKSHVSKSGLRSDFGTAMPTEVSTYERIGIKDDELAIDVDPVDVINFLGTREDLIDKALADIPSLDRSKAEEEVSKFLLDSDAVKVYIEYQRRKAEDPDFVVPSGEEDEGFFTVRNVFILYLSYLASSNSPDAIKEWVKSKEIAGEWSGTGIPFLDTWLSQSTDALSAVDVGSVASSVADVVN
mmetsp:Transcript_12595/g.16553  ORF Transcript_12595/g.16553 Transcript_12595/m.16553 type:complete len:206 (+) Transcript_12595:185-802(+)